MHRSTDKAVRALAIGLVGIAVGVGGPVLAAPPSASKDKPAASREATTSDGGVSPSAIAQRFQEPRLEVAARPAFGASAGRFEAFTPMQTPPQEPMTLVWVMGGVTLAAFAGAALAAWTLSRTRRPDGSTGRAMTLGAKLSLSMGGLVTTLALTGTIALNAQRGVANNGIRVAEMASDADAVAQMERDLTRVRMSVRNFMLSNSSDDLARYSDAAAALDNRFDVLERVITNPERAAIVKGIHESADQYASAFASLVPVIDERNALVSTQMAPTAAQAESLLASAQDASERAGDASTTALLRDAEREFGEARVSFFKYLRFLQADMLAGARQRVANAVRLSNQAAEGAEDAQAQSLAGESHRALAFWSQRLEACTAAQAKRMAIEDEQLDKIAPQLVEGASKLVASLKGVQQTGVEDARKQVASARVQIGALVVVSLLVACAVATIIVRSITRTSARLVTTLSSIASRDLTLPATNSTASDEFGQLARATDAVLTSLRDVVGEVRSTSNQVAAAATEIAASSEEMARGMEQQSGQVQQISSAVQEMTASVQEVAQKSADAAGRAHSSGSSATEGEKVVEQTIVGMRSINEAVSASSSSVAELGKRGEQIGEIIKVINDIADQTNLLALNAAIEAARAGEHGRGFAVVADEVRKLAERTQRATEEVGESIRAIQQETRVAVDRMDAGTKQVVQGVEMAQTAGHSLRTIVSSAQDVAGLIRSIAASAEQQSAASEQISRNIESISSVTREATSGAAQAAQAASELSTKAEQLRAIVNRFKLAQGAPGDDSHASPRPRERAKAGAGPHASVAA
jgi:methyl-accepting chemotaxis protein/CHASE3 domain sensor protein